MPFVPHRTEDVATLSHEIRTPLNTITGYWEMLADAALEPYSPQWNDVIGRIQRSVQELLDRVSAALDLAAAHQGRRAAPVSGRRTPVALRT